MWWREWRKVAQHAHARQTNYVILPLPSLGFTRLVPSIGTFAVSAENLCITTENPIRRLLLLQPRGKISNQQSPSRPERAKGHSTEPQTTQGVV